MKIANECAAKCITEMPRRNGACIMLKNNEELVVSNLA